MLTLQEMRARLDALEAELNAGGAVSPLLLRALEPAALHWAAQSEERHPLPRLARLLLRARDPAAACDLLAKAVEMSPGSTVLRLLLANATTELGDHSRALEALAPLLDGADADAAVLGRAAELNARLGRREESLALHRRAARKDVSRRKWLINALITAGRREEALDQAKAALRALPHDPVLVFACFNALSRFSDDKADIAAARDRLLQILPSDASGALWRARLYRWEQDFERAMVELDAALSVRPADANLLRERAGVAIALGYWGRDAAAIHAAAPLTRDLPELGQAVARADAFLHLHGGSLEEAARDASRFAHVRTPEGVFEHVVRTTPRAPSRPGTGLAMIAHSLTAGGAERVIANLLRHFKADRRFDWVKLYLLNLSSKDGTDFYLPLTGLHPSEVVLLDRQCEIEPPFSFLPADPAKTVQAIYDQLQSDRPDIVHVSLEPLTLYAGLAALKAGVPRIVMHTHNMRPTDLHPGAPLPPRWRDCYGALLQRPEIRLVGCAQASIDDYADWIGLTDRSNLHVVYNGLDFDRFRPPQDGADPARRRAELGIPSDAVLIGTAFKFRAEKRPLLWVQAALEVLRHRPNTRFVMFGDGPLLHPTREFIAASGASGSFSLPGLVADLHNWLPMLDLFVLSSSSEALPNVLLEAQACGVAVVAHRVGGIAETMIDGETGLLVGEDSAAALAQAMLRAGEDPLWRRNVVQAGPRFVRKRFSTERMLATLAGVLLPAQTDTHRRRPAAEVVRFMLLMPWGRVGSNLLYEIVRQHAQGWSKLANESLNAIPTASAQQTWLERFYEAGEANPANKLIGSKQNLLSIHDFGAVERFMTDNGVRVVRLRRDNLVKSALSQIRAEQYADFSERELGDRRWALYNGAAPMGPTRVDPAILLERIALMERAQARLMAAFAGHEVMEIEYEQINSGLDDAVDALRSFLDLPRKPYRVPFAKMTPDELSQAFLNYAEIRESLSGTPYAAML